MKKEINAKELEWIHKPERYIVDKEKVVLETEPYTDISGKRPGAEAIELSLQPKGNFRFTVRADFEYHDVLDACGILLYDGKKRVMICGSKRHNAEVDALECIVFHDKYGDRSSREIGTAIQHLYYRIWYREGAIRVQYSFNGRIYADVRQFHLTVENPTISIGIFACSPGNSSFDCTFSQMELKEERKEDK